MNLTITNEQQIEITLHPVSQGGQPVSVENIQWSVVSGNSTVIHEGPDATTAILRSEDGVGDTVFLVQADADLGEGVETISDTIVLTVGSPHAQNLGLSAGEPTLKT